MAAQPDTQAIDVRLEAHADRRREVLWLLGAWLALVVVAVAGAVFSTNDAQLITAATVGVAIAFGGVYLAYSWVVIAGVRERERLRTTLERAAATLREAEEAAIRAKADTWPAGTKN